ncbi:MAG: hypothetical protein J6R72_01845, partial [Candidatus Methanomethylophilaceae archaeon]|nr:hypothetical protein [Candidatus Methanomethylophilaceae archaeon]
FSSIKTTPGKGKVRKFLKPAPFISIVLALLLVVGPNVTYVVDASISSNDVDDYNEGISSLIDKEPFGALSYYIKTDDSWKVRDALKDISSTVDDGALITWMDYSADAPLYAGLKSYTDTNGHGMVTASNILLGNAINGASSAALLVNAIIYLGGVNDDVKAQISVLGADVITVIENVLNDVEYKVGGKTVKYIVTTDVETYGKVTEDISDENVKYLFLTNFLAESCPQYDINQAYDNVAAANDLATPYIMVTGDMMPFYYGYAGVFNEMALLNGYEVDSSSYFTVDKFTQFGYYAYYYGIYGFTDAMYDTLLYRTYIGMSPAEAGYSSLYEYMIALASADASVVMQPGYGLGNYSVAYWQVMYNADDEETSYSDGWVQMDGNAAIAKQKDEGGLINYLSGLPVILRYDGNDTGNMVTGNVAGAGFGEVRISAYDSKGNLGATTFTDANGNYKLYVKNPSESVLVYYAGSQGLTGGVIIGTGAASSVPSVSLPTVTVDLSLYYTGAAGEIDISGYTVTLTNSVTDEVIDYIDGMEIPLGTYSVSIKNGETSVYSGSFTTSLVASQNVALYVDGYDYKITLKDSFKQVVADADVDIYKDGKKFADASYDSAEKVYKVVLPKGDYSVVAKDYFIESPSLTVSSASSKSFDVSKGKTYTLSNDGNLYTFVNDVYRTSVLAVDNAVVTLPVSEFGKTAYTVSYIVGDKIYYDLIEDIVAGSHSFVDADVKNVSGTLKTSTGSAVSGTVTLYAANGAMFRASVASDGTFTVYNAPAVDLFIYATNGTTEAYMGKLNAADSTVDITMEAADSISPAVKWDTIAAKYLNVVVNNVDGLTGFDLYFAVNSNGSYKFLAPKSLGMAVTLSVVGNMYFKVSDSVADQTITSVLNSTTRSISTYTLIANDTASVTEKVIKINNDDGLLTILGEEYYLSIGTADTVKKARDDGFAAKSSITYTLGKVATEANQNSGIYYATGTYYYNPFDDGFSISLSKLLGYSTLAEAEKAITYQNVQITGLDDSDVVTIKGDYKPGNASASLGKEYLFKASAIEDALITIKNADGTKIQYASIENSSIATIAKDLKDKVVVKGFVGLLADGTATVKYGTTEVEFDVDEGSYELVLYKNEPVTVSISVTKNGAKFVRNDVTFTPADNETRNIIVEGYGAVEAETVTTSGDLYKNVTGTINLTSTNTGKAGYFTIKFGAAWESAYATIGGKTVTQIYVAENGTFPDFVVAGYYNSSMYDLGSKEMMITLDGPDYDQYIRLDVDTASNGLVYVNKVDDIVSNHAYSYVVEVNNLTGMEAAFSWSASIVATGWSIVVEHEALGVLYNVNYIDIPGSVGGYALPGLNVYKITFIPVANATDVPALNLSLDFSGLNVATLTSGSGVTINGTTASIVAEAGSAVVSATDMDASGRGVLNELSGIPTIVWVLFALAIILAILTVWMASKRGVFARRK